MRTRCIPFAYGQMTPHGHPYWGGTVTTGHYHERAPLFVPVEDVAPDAGGYAGA